MKKKYNLALTPTSINKEVIRYANHFYEIADSYCLGPHSLPHVTLYHFWYEETQINSCWENVCKAWQAPPLYLQFDQFSFLTFYKKIYWISLLPNNIDMLHNMHQQIATLLNLPIKEDFQPHMTLVNTKIDNKQEVEKVEKIYSPLKDNFILSLGSCDEVGQLTQILKGNGAKT